MFLFFSASDVNISAWSEPLEQRDAQQSHQVSLLFRILFQESVATRQDWAIFSLFEPTDFVWEACCLLFRFGTLRTAAHSAS